MRARTNHGDFRKNLLAERSRIMARLSAEAKPFEALPVVAEDDQPSLLHDHFVETALNDLEFDLLDEIDKALDRLARDGYGACEECGEAIGVRRLTAVPWARRCISCEELAAVPSLREEMLVAA